MSVGQSGKNIIAGSPGQPVQTGTLRNSWQTTIVSPTEVLISSNLAYAPVIEDGVGRHGKPLTLRSHVGGFHSVAHTLTNIDRLVDQVTREVAGT